jgi:hypothetical protein
LAKRAVHFHLDVTLYGHKGKRCPTKVQAWTFKMTMTPALSSYIRYTRPEDKVKSWVLFSVVCLGLTVNAEVEDHLIFRNTLVHTGVRAHDFVHFPDL